MKAVRLHKFHTQPVIDEVPEPKISGPLDVIVKIGGAGVCRTDLHIIEGQWDAAMGTPLPYILGHENAGWVHEVGSAVTNVAVGDTVILHPTPTDGLCHACRAGDDMHCENSEFPGLSRDGGMAEYLLTSARACIKLNPETQPKDVAALADAGITAYHAVRKAIPLLYPGTTCVIIGAGGLGHIGVQCVSALTAADIIVVDRNPAALKLYAELDDGTRHLVFHRHFRQLSCNHKELSYPEFHWSTFWDAVHLLRAACHATHVSTGKLSEFWPAVQEAYLGGVA